MTVPAAATPRPWMYRPNPGKTKEDWSFHIDRQGTPGRMNWGVLIAACWGHVSESAEANAALIVTAVNAWDSPTSLRARLAELEGKG